MLLLERLPLTVLLSGITLLFAYAVAIPIGIYSATHQYSLAASRWLPEPSRDGSAPQHPRRLRLDVDRGTHSPVAERLPSDLSPVK